jgi:hypothetical protein
LICCEKEGKLIIVANDVENCDAHLIIKKYEIHLDENECHTRGWSESQQNIMAFRILL